MKRRDFIKSSGLASAALFAPAFLQARQALDQEGNILIVIQLSGGNDGLNTVVPYRNDLYYQSRPQLALPQNEVLTISDELGLHPALQPLQSLYDQGLLSIVNSVGYPNPDRSHFRSMDIWHTASESSEYLQTGWLGRYLDHQCSGCDRPYHAIEVDDTLSLALKGNHRNGFALSDPQRLQRMALNKNMLAVGKHAADHDHPEEVAYLYKTLVDTQSSAQYLAEKSRKGQVQSEYPQTQFGRDLQLIGRLITGGAGARVYYAGLTGFDTHANQKNRQERLLKEYAAAVGALTGDLQKQGRLQNTLILTFSEFGRRVAQNAGQGTDHGTANNVFLIGGQLHKPGFFNEAPDLSSLDNGDLRYQIDFRSLYASLLEDWLESDAKNILGGQVRKVRLV